ncbi:Conserved_hypothetical protein [Hexamita inflata]|uniref:Transmembrane protein n=1 Tax=Hexamita inflata TaxID=28002 RepID=A0AA86Q5L0_9EUKA|nr:Conserved hypothetical protein [Hexamita inflata]
MMLLLQIGQQFDTPQRTQRLNCYHHDSSIEYNPNLRTFTLHLVSQNNTNCQNVFPPGLSLNLTLASVAVNVITVLIDKYYYENTTTIEITIPASITDAMLTSFTDEHFAIVHLFSYSDIAPIELLIFDEQKTDLNNCFSALSLDVTNTDITFSATPTKICRMQMISCLLKPTSCISKVVLNVDVQQFTLDLAAFLLGYQAGAITQTITDATKAQLIRQLSFVSADLTLYSTQGTLNINWFYHISTVNIGSLVGLFTYTTVTTSNSTIHIQFDYDPVQLAVLKSQLTTYTTIIYRIAIDLTGTTDYVFQQSMAGPFNSLIRDIEINCYFGVDHEIEKCFNFYNGDKTGVYNFQLLFYNKDQFLSVQLTQATYVNSCWTQMSVEKLTGKLCANLMINNKCDATYTGSETMQYITDTQTITLTQEATITGQTIQRCFDCSNSADCNTILNGADGLYVYQIAGTDFKYNIQTHKVVQALYKDTTITPVVIGMACIVFSVAITIYEMAKTQANIKKLKMKKHR